MSRFIDLVYDYSLFVGLSFFLRILEAVGTSGIYVTVYSFVGKELSPELVGSIFVSISVFLFFFSYHLRLATDTKISGVSVCVGVGVEISTPKKFVVRVGVRFFDGAGVAVGMAQCRFF
jgi:hypothetical protein